MKIDFTNIYVFWKKKVNFPVSDVPEAVWIVIVFEKNTLTAVAVTQILYRYDFTLMEIWYSLQSYFFSGS